MSSKKKSSQSTGNKKGKKSGTGTSNVSKVFYLIMLLLILSSSFIRIMGSNRRKSATKTPTPTSAAAGVGEMPALTLSYHYEDTVGKTCQDLTISAIGKAVYSDCLKGTNKDYTLSSSEMSLLQGWSGHFQTIQYDHPLLTKTGKVDTQLFLNGTGSTQADDNVDQRIENFAKDLIDKITAQS
jgi:hypothetical protein